MTDSYGQAWYRIGQIIFFTDWLRLSQEDKANVEKVIDFQKIASDYGLSKKQCEGLIKRAQARVDKKLKSFIPEAQCPATAIGQG